MTSGITVTVDTMLKGTGFAATTKGVKTVGDAADATKRQLVEMEGKLDSAETKARRFAQAEERAAEKARRLAADLALTKTEMARAGDESGQLGRKVDRLSTDLRFAAIAQEEYRRSASKASSEAREQARALDRVADNARAAARAVTMFGAATALTPSGGKGGGPGGAGKGALGLGSTFSEGLLKGGLGGGFSALEGAIGTPVVGPALLAAAAPAAAGGAMFLGGAAGGGIGLGAGALGAGLGLGAAWASDPDKYRAKWDAALDKLEHRFKASGSGFTKELEDGLKIVSQTMEQLPLEKLMAASHGISTPLLTGAGQGTVQAAEGLADLAAAGRDLAEDVGPKLAELGHSVGDALRAIGMGSEGGSQALGDLIDVMGYAVKATGIMILGFEQGYERLRNFGEGALDVANRIPGLSGAIHQVRTDFLDLESSSIVSARALDTAGDSTTNYASRLSDMVGAGADAVVAANALNDALTNTHNTMMALADANVAVAQGWLDLTEGLKDGAKTLDLTKQAGIDNNKTIMEQVDALERQRQQAIETSDGTVAAQDKANAAYDAGIERIKKTAHELGFTDSQVNQLIASLGAVPSSTTTNVRTPGLASGLEQGIALGNALNRIDGRVVYAQVHVSTAMSGITAGILQGMGRRSGGPTSRAATGGPRDGGVWVGEDGPEWVTLPTGSMVNSKATSNQMAAQSRAGGGGGTVVELRFSGGGALYDLFMRGMDTGEIQVPEHAIVTR